MSTPRVTAGLPAYVGTSGGGKTSYLSAHSISSPSTTSPDKNIKFQSILPTHAVADLSHQSDMSNVSHHRGNNVYNSTQANRTSSPPKTTRNTSIITDSTGKRRNKESMSRGGDPYYRLSTGTSSTTHESHYNHHHNNKNNNSITNIHTKRVNKMTLVENQRVGGPNGDLDDEDDDEEVPLFLRPVGDEGGAWGGRYSYYNSHYQQQQHDNIDGTPQPPRTLSVSNRSNGVSGETDENNNTSPPPRNTKVGQNSASNFTTFAGERKEQKKSAASDKRRSSQAITPTTAAKTAHTALVDPKSFGIQGELLPTDVVMSNTSTTTATLRQMLREAKAGVFDIDAKKGQTIGGGEGTVGATAVSGNRTEGGSVPPVPSKLGNKNSSSDEQLVGDTEEEETNSRRKPALINSEGGHASLPPSESPSATSPTHSRPPPLPPQLVDAYVNEFYEKGAVHKARLLHIESENRRYESQLGLTVEEFTRRKTRRGVGVGGADDAIAGGSTLPSGGEEGGHDGASGGPPNLMGRTNNSNHNNTPQGSPQASTPTRRRQASIAKSSQHRSSPSSVPAKTIVADEHGIVLGLGLGLNANNLHLAAAQHQHLSQRANSSTHNNNKNNNNSDKGTPLRGGVGGGSLLFSLNSLIYPPTTTTTPLPTSTTPNGNGGVADSYLSAPLFSSAKAGSASPSASPLHEFNATAIRTTSIANRNRVGNLAGNTNSSISNFGGNRTGDADPHTARGDREGMTNLTLGGITFSNTIDLLDNIYATYPALAERETFAMRKRVDELEHEHEILSLVEDREEKARRREDTLKEFARQRELRENAAIVLANLEVAREARRAKAERARRRRKRRGDQRGHTEELSNTRRQAQHSDHHHPEAAVAAPSPSALLSSSQRRLRKLSNTSTASVESKDGNENEGGGGDVDGDGDEDEDALPHEITMRALGAKLAGPVSQFRIKELAEATRQLRILEDLENTRAERRAREAYKLQKQKRKLAKQQQKEALRRKEAEAAKARRGERRRRREAERALGGAWGGTTDEATMALLRKIEKNEQQKQQRMHREEERGIGGMIIVPAASSSSSSSYSRSPSSCSSSFKGSNTNNTIRSKASPRLNSSSSSSSASNDSFSSTDLDSELDDEVDIDTRHIPQEDVAYLASVLNARYLHGVNPFAPEEVRRAQEQEVSQFLSFLSKERAQRQIAAQREAEAAERQANANATSNAKRDSKVSKDDLTLNDSTSRTKKTSTHNALNNNNNDIAVGIAATKEEEEDESSNYDFILRALDRYASSLSARSLSARSLHQQQHQDSGTTTSKKQFSSQRSLLETKSSPESVGRSLSRGRLLHVHADSDGQAERKSAGTGTAASTDSPASHGAPPPIAAATNGIDGGAHPSKGGAGGGGAQSDQQVMNKKELWDSSESDKDDTPKEKETVVQQQVGSTDNGANNIGNGGAVAAATELKEVPNALGKRAAMRSFRARGPIQSQRDGHQQQQQRDVNYHPSADSNSPFVDTKDPIPLYALGGKKNILDDTDEKEIAHIIASAAYVPTQQPAELTDACESAIHFINSSAIPSKLALYYDENGIRRDTRKTRERAKRKAAEAQHALGLGLGLFNNKQPATNDDDNLSNNNTCAPTGQKEHYNSAYLRLYAHTYDALDNEEKGSKEGHTKRGEEKKERDDDKRGTAASSIGGTYIPLDSEDSPFRGKAAHDLDARVHWANPLPVATNNTKNARKREKQTPIMRFGGEGTSQHRIKDEIAAAKAAQQAAVLAEEAFLEMRERIRAQVLTEAFGFDVSKEPLPQVVTAQARPPYLKALILNARFESPPTPAEVVAYYKWNAERLRRRKELRLSVVSREQQLKQHQQELNEEQQLAEHHKEKRGEAGSAERKMLLPMDSPEGEEGGKVNGARCATPESPSYFCGMNTSPAERSLTGPKTTAGDGNDFPEYHDHNNDVLRLASAADDEQYESPDEFSMLGGGGLGGGDPSARVSPAIEKASEMLLRRGGDRAAAVATSAATAISGGEKNIFSSHVAQLESIAVDGIRMASHLSAPSAAMRTLCADPHRYLGFLSVCGARDAAVYHEAICHVEWSHRGKPNLNSTPPEKENEMVNKKGEAAEPDDAPANDAVLVKRGGTADTSQRDPSGKDETLVLGLPFISHPIIVTEEEALRAKALADERAIQHEQAKRLRAITASSISASYTKKKGSDDGSIDINTAAATRETEKSLSLLLLSPKKKMGNPNADATRILISRCREGPSCPLLRGAPMRTISSASNHSHGELQSTGRVGTSPTSSPYEHHHHDHHHHLVDEADATSIGGLGATALRRIKNDRFLSLDTLLCGLEGIGIAQWLTKDVKDDWVDRDEFSTAITSKAGTEKENEEEQEDDGDDDDAWNRELRMVGAGQKKRNSSSGDHKVRGGERSSSAWSSAWAQNTSAAAAADGASLSLLSGKAKEEERNDEEDEETRVLSSAVGPDGLSKNYKHFLRPLHEEFEFVMAFLKGEIQEDFSTREASGPNKVMSSSSSAPPLSSSSASIAIKKAVPSADIESFRDVAVYEHSDVMGVRRVWAKQRVAEAAEKAKRSWSSAKREGEGRGVLERLKRERDERDSEVAQDQERWVARTEALLRAPLPFSSSSSSSSGSDADETDNTSDRANALKNARTTNVSGADEPHAIRPSSRNYQQQFLELQQHQQQKNHFMRLPEALRARIMERKQARADFGEVKRRAAAMDCERTTRHEHEHEHGLSAADNNKDRHRHQHIVLPQLRSAVPLDKSGGKGPRLAAERNTDLIKTEQNLPLLVKTSSITRGVAKSAEFGNGINDNDNDDTSIAPSSIIADARMSSKRSDHEGGGSLLLPPLFAVPSSQTRTGTDLRRKPMKLYTREALERSGVVCNHQVGDKNVDTVTAVDVTKKRDTENSGPKSKPAASPSDPNVSPAEAEAEADGDAYAALDLVEYVPQTYLGANLRELALSEYALVEEQRLQSARKATLDRWGAMHAQSMSTTRASGGPSNSVSISGANMSYIGGTTSSAAGQTRIPSQIGAAATNSPHSPETAVHEAAERMVSTRRSVRVEVGVAGEEVESAEHHQANDEKQTIDGDGVHTAWQAQGKKHDARERGGEEEEGLFSRVLEGDVGERREERAEVPAYNRAQRLEVLHQLKQATFLNSLILGRMKTN